MRASRLTSTCVLLALLAVGCGRVASYPRGVRGQILTEDGRSGVNCVVQLHDDPRPGTTDTVVASAVVKSGAPFERDLDLVKRDGPASKLLHVSFACDGYQPRVREFEWNPSDVVLAPIVDLGSVTIAK